MGNWCKMTTAQVTKLKIDRIVKKLCANLVTFRVKIFEWIDTLLLVTIRHNLCGRPVDLFLCLVTYLVANPFATSNINICSCQNYNWAEIMSLIRLLISIHSRFLQGCIQPLLLWDKLIAQVNKCVNWEYRSLGKGSYNFTWWLHDLPFIH